MDLDDDQLCFDLEFEDFIDLQTRLVLLPHKDDECTGAKIHSYIPKEEQQEKNVERVIDALLVHIDGFSSKKIELEKEDFSSILSAIRDSSTPIVLRFTRLSHLVDDKNMVNNLTESPSTVEENDSESDDVSDISMSSEEDVDIANEIKNKLSRWGSKFADVAVRHANNAVQAGREKLNDGHDRRVSSNTTCGLFLQTSSGRCIQLNDVSSKTNVTDSEDIQMNHDENRTRKIFSKHRPIITNTSVLVIRKSAETACPHLGYSYQWYRSFLVSNPDHTNLIENWFLLEGETSAVFQPTTTDIGFRFKCIVFIQDDGNKRSEVICELPYKVQCDETLFDAASKLLHPLNDVDDSLICSFDHMYTEDDSSNLNRVNIMIHTKRCKDTSKQSGFHMILQKADELVSTGDQFRVTKVSARASNSSSRFFYLIFENDGFQQKHTAVKLEAPCRISRETFLITLGIAKYTGDFINLHKDTTLFSELPISDNDLDLTPVSQILTKHFRMADKEISTPSKDSDQQLMRSWTPFNTKMIELETEIEHDLGILRDKLETKNKIVSELQDQVSDLINEKSSQQEEIHSLKIQLYESQEKMKHLESSLSNERAENVQLQAQTNDLMAQLQLQKVDYDKTIKSLQNETAVLSAAVETRDQKLEDFAAFKDELVTLRKQLNENDQLSNQMLQLSNENNVLQEQLKIMSSISNNLNDKIKKLENELQDSLHLLVKERDSCSDLILKSNRLEESLLSLQGERKSFKQRIESLTKEMSRMRKNEKAARDFETMLKQNEELQEEIAKLRSERRAISDELEATKIAHEVYVESSEQRGTKDVDLMRALQKCVELERVVADLTEYLNAKEMQLDTVQSANRELCKELLTMSLNENAKRDN